MKNILYQESIVEIKHLFRMMRNTLLALFVFAGTAFATESYSQTMKVTVVADNVSTGKVISEIEKQTDYLFVYNVNEVNLKRNVKVNAQNKSVAEVLNKVFEGTDIYYAMEGKNIMLMSKAKDGEAAQQANKVTGIVKDANGEPVIGANVMVKGQSIGTITDIDGRFVLDAPKEAVLQITYIGYVSQEVKVSGKREINVVLKEDTETLDEVVVVGFGTQKKVNLTGAVGLATAKELESRPVTSATQALQGLVPGLQISTSTGELDKTADISIRGTGTIGEGSSGAPLILIDGMEGDLNTVNPQDIENISVLKDAAASSIYGSRAPFGVILITTKSGKAGRTSVNYSTNVRFKSPMSMPEMMDSWSFANYWNEAGINQNGNIKFTQDVMDKILAFQQGTLTGPDAAGISWQDGEWKKYAGAWANTDWFKEQYHSIVSNEHNISVNGGTDKVTYMVSAGYMGDKGLTRHGDDRLTRYNLSGKINATLSKYVKLMYNTKFIREDYDRPSYLTSNFYHNIARRWPTNPVKDANGYYLDHSEIIQMEEGGRDVTQKDQFYQQIQLVVEPLKDWLIHAEGNMKIVNNQNQWEVLPVYYHDGEGSPVAMAWFDGYTPGMSRVNQSYWKDNNYSLNLYTDYFKQIGDHYFKVMGGFNAELYKRTNLSGQRDELITPDVPTLNTGTTEQKANGGYSHWANAGFFGRINYNYKERYLLEINGRYDGSSRFIGDKRWGFFPSFSAGWNVSREPFWRDLEHIVNNFKIRGSWGELGNCNTTAFYPFYQTMPTGVENSGWLINGKKPNTASAPGIVSAEMTWETVRSWNIGFDFGLLNNRLTGSFDYFVRNTLDMIGPAPQLPATLGATVPKVNNADMKAWGFEVEVSWRDRIKDFNYGVKFVLSDDQRKVTRYPNEELNRNQWYAGRMDGLVWGYETVGIAKTDAEMEAHLASLPNGGQSQLGSKWAAGDIMYKDLNGDGKISSGDGTLNDLGDLKVVANTQLRFKYGLTLDASWKGFDFSAFFQGVGKRDVVVGGPYFWGANGQGMWQAAAFKDHMDYFRPEDTESVFGPNVDAYYPRVIFGGGSSEGGKNTLTQSRYVQNGAYIRLKNLQLGYTLPSTITKKFAVNSLRVYVSGDNLWTGTKMRVFDPEVLGSTGDAGKAYPLARVWSVGLNVNF